MDVKNCGFISHAPFRFAFGWDEEDEQCMVLKQVMLQQIQLIRSQGCKSFYVVPDSGAGLWFGEMVNVLRNEDSDLMLQCHSSARGIVYKVASRPAPALFCVARAMYAPYGCGPAG